MEALAATPRRGDGHLWMIALALSLLVNLIILTTVGIAAIRLAAARKATTPPPPPPVESIAMIYPDALQTPAEATPAAPKKPRFARTSEDQRSSPRENAPYLGERDTQATSDRTPDRNAARLPSQKGIEPRDESDIETTESNYQDGSLSSTDSPSPAVDTPPSPLVPEPPKPIDPTMAAKSQAVENPDEPGPDKSLSTPPPREELLDGPNPVDVQVPREPEMTREIKPTPQKRPAAQNPQPKQDEKPVVEEAPKPTPKPPKVPGFKGYQRKTAVVGSISRTGRSSLEVADTPLGRYQASISRAVEQEWQRNCVRHRDFITPGFLTVRFFVQTSGKIRSVQFVGDMETGEVQKGFTLNSIRDAAIPAMPRALRKEYSEEPLELIFRFYF